MIKDFKYLNRIFSDYYKKAKAEISVIDMLPQREFAFFLWDKKSIMMRHMGFNNRNNFINFLITSGPRHVYSSGTLYQHPENQEMASKDYLGCDFIIDIDVDHFYTPCKEDHDLWHCKECGKAGKGMVSKCPSCNKTKIQTITWICEECLNIAKNEIIKLIYDFLNPDFGISLDQIKITFSGHRGYHLKIKDEKIRTLSSEERREIADYISGENISFEILGLREKSGTIYGFSEENFGWAQKCIREIKDILNKSNAEIHNILINKRKFNLKADQITSFLNFKDRFLNTIQNRTNNVWPSENFGIKSWNSFLKGIAHEIGVEIDTPVTVDIHRLIRYPGSLHGKTGFKVQELNPDDLDLFNPLNELNETLDPIVFESKVKTTQKIEITASEVPATKIKGEIYGPYVMGQKVEVPHHIAVFLLCKEVAKTI
ncbi:MAG: DNA primase small subunit domain-containing protein [Promethearchaeota archaeon]